MHIWDTNRLVKKIGTKSISEMEKLRYYIFTLIVFSISAEMPMWFPSGEPYNGLDFASFVTLVLTTIIGNVVVFKANRDGSDYVSRAICLTIPIGFKLLLVLILILIPIFFVFTHLGWISETGLSIQEQVTFMGLWILFDVIYFSLLYRAIKQVNEIIEGEART
jgi:hypothetical protein